MLTLNCAPCQAAAKMEVPLSLYSETALDTIPIQPGSYSAALCFDMLDGAPEQAAAGAVSLLANALKPGGRMLFLEREKVGMPDLVREYGGCSVEFDTEGGFDVGGIPFNPDPDPTLPCPAPDPTSAPTASAPSACACLSSGPGPRQIGVATRRVVGKAPGGKRGKEKPKPKGAGPPLGAKAGLTGFGAPAAEPRVKKEFAKKVKRTPEEKAAAQAAAEQEKREAAAVLARAAEQVEAEQALKRAAADRAAAERAAAEAAAAEEAAAKQAAAEQAAAEEEEAAAAERAVAAAAAAELAEQAAAAAAFQDAEATRSAAEVRLEQIEEFRRLLRRETIDGVDLSDAEDERLKFLWKANEEECDRIDAEMEEEEEAAEAVEGVAAAAAGAAAAADAAAAEAAALVAVTQAEAAVATAEAEAARAAVRAAKARLAAKKNNMS